MNDDLQHYPTPAALAQRAWKKFTNRDFERVLEPHAGCGDLMEPYLNGSGRRAEWDAIEIDVRHHASLKDKRAAIVGFDFLAHGSCAIYSHIIMNPPFANGATHVLHAWDTLYDGEIVAIVNAETVRNPYTSERTRLARLIQEHGSVEYIDDAFKGAEVIREAQVAVALIHLHKKADGASIIGQMEEDLKADEAGGSIEWEAGQDLALPANLVESAVREFNVAVAAAQEAAIASSKAAHYATRLGRPLEQMLGDRQGGSDDVTVQSAGPRAREIYAQSYADLKNRAWARIIQSLEVLSKLSYRAQQKVHSEFETIKKLEFTVANVYGFLRGLCEAADEIQMDMLCDLFDNITRYHSDNTVYYMGWKSNDKHRTTGMRIKAKRFILPGWTKESWSSSCPWKLEQWLGDFDKVFALLDGKSDAHNGLRSVFSNQETFAQLCAGKRLASAYFEVRYYPGAGTIHFFPTRKDLIDRLNRMVGRHRQWLPPAGQTASADFEKQYEQAEALHREVSGAIKARIVAGYHSYDWALRALAHSQDGQAHEAICNQVNGVLEQVLASHDIRPFEQLETGDTMPLLLCA